MKKMSVILFLVFCGYEYVSAINPNDDFLDPKYSILNYSFPTSIEYYNGPHNL
jgi:hypothetical protein